MPIPARPSSGVDPRQSRLRLLEELYQRLEQALPKASGNPCGRCRECCTGGGLSRHNVTAIELDLIALRVGTERLTEFRRFLRRDGQVELCPYFDEQIWGCGIYRHRPYSCRVFGHHRSSDTRLPDVCVFSGQERIFEVAQYYQAVPLAAELRELSRGYWPYQREHFPNAERLEQAGFDSHPTAAPAGDALDRSLLRMASGELEQALQELEASDLPSTPYVLYCLSLIFEGLARHDDAVTALEVALEQAPECCPLWFRLACNLTSLGQLWRAEQAFRRSIELQPEHSQAHGLLGGLLLGQGLATAALPLLERAQDLDPSSEPIRRLLQRARLTA
jgi:Fe-S-cluster containining protein